MKNNLLKKLSTRKKKTRTRTHTYSRTFRFEHLRPPAKSCDIQNVKFKQNTGTIPKKSVAPSLKPRGTQQKPFGEEGYTKRVQNVNNLVR